MFKQIEDFNYEINELGQVRNTKFNKFIKPFDNGNGYMGVSLCKNGKKHFRHIHRLLLTYFSDDLPKEHVNHKDGNPKNNSLSNLEWCTSSENHKHRHHILNKTTLKDSITGKFTSGKGSEWTTEKKLKLQQVLKEFPSGTWTKDITQPLMEPIGQTILTTLEPMNMNLGN